MSSSLQDLPASSSSSSQGSLTSPLRIAKRRTSQSQLPARRSSTCYKHVRANNLVSNSPFKVKLAVGSSIPVTASTYPRNTSTNSAGASATALPFPATRRVSGEKRPRPLSLQAENERPFAIKRERKQSKGFQGLIEREPVTKSPFKLPRTQQPEPQPQQQPVPKPLQYNEEINQRPSHQNPDVQPLKTQRNDNTNISDPQPLSSEPRPATPPSRVPSLATNESASRPSPTRSALVSRRLHGPRGSFTNSNPTTHSGSDSHQQSQSVGGGSRRARRKTVTFDERCDVVEFDRDSLEDIEVFSGDEIVDRSGEDDDEGEDGFYQSWRRSEHESSHNERSAQSQPEILPATGNDSYESIQIDVGDSSTISSAGYKGKEKGRGGRALPNVPPPALRSQRRASSGDSSPHHEGDSSFELAFAQFHYVGGSNNACTPNSSPSVPKSVHGTPSSGHRISTQPLSTVSPIAEENLAKSRMRSPPPRSTSSYSNMHPIPKLGASPNTNGNINADLTTSSPSLNINKKTRSSSRVSSASFAGLERNLGNDERILDIDFDFGGLDAERFHLDDHEDEQSQAHQTKVADEDPVTADVNASFFSEVASEGDVPLTGDIDVSFGDDLSSSLSFGGENDSALSSSVSRRRESQMAFDPEASLAALEKELGIDLGGFSVSMEEDSEVNRAQSVKGTPPRVRTMRTTTPTQDVTPLQTSTPPSSTHTRTIPIGSPFVQKQSSRGDYLDDSANDPRNSFDHGIPSSNSGIVIPRLGSANTIVYSDGSIPPPNEGPSCGASFTADAGADVFDEPGLPDDIQGDDICEEALEAQDTGGTIIAAHDTGDTITMSSGGRPRITRSEIQKRLMCQSSEESVNSIGSPSRRRVGSTSPRNSPRMSSMCQSAEETSLPETNLLTRSVSGSKLPGGFGDESEQEEDMPVDDRPEEIGRGRAMSTIVLTDDESGIIERADKVRAATPTLANFAEASSSTPGQLQALPVEAHAPPTAAFDEPEPHDVLDNGSPTPIVAHIPSVSHGNHAPIELHLPEPEPRDDEPVANPAGSGLLGFDFASRLGGLGTRFVLGGLGLGFGGFGGNENAVTSEVSSASSPFGSGDGARIPYIPDTARTATNPTPHNDSQLLHTTNANPGHPNLSPGPVVDGRRLSNATDVDVDMRSALDRLLDDVKESTAGADADTGLGLGFGAGEETADEFETADESASIDSGMRKSNKRTSVLLPSNFASPVPSRNVSVASSLVPPPPLKDARKSREEIILEKRREARRREDGIYDEPPPPLYRGAASSPARASDPSSEAFPVGENQGAKLTRSDAGKLLAPGAGRPSRRRSMSTGDAEVLSGAAKKRRAAMRADSSGLLDDVVPSADDMFGESIDQALRQMDEIELPKSKYQVREREGMIYASSDADRISHMDSAGDVDGGKAWRTVRRPSDMNEYSKQIKEYRAQEKPGKAHGKVFVRVLGVKGLDVPLPQHASVVTCTLNNGIHFVTTPEVRLGRDCRIDQEFELIEHSKLEFTLTMKVRRDPHIIAEFKALAHRAPLPPAPPPPPPVAPTPSKGGMRSFFSSSPKKTAKEKVSAPQPPHPAPVLPPPITENLARYLKPDGTLARSFVSFKDIAARCDTRLFETSYPLIGQKVEAGGKVSTLQVGELMLQMFRLPPLPVISPEQLPQSLEECHRGLRHVNWHKVTYFEGTLTQNGGDCMTWRRRQLRVIGANLVAFNDVTKRATVTIDLKKAIAVEDDQDARSNILSPQSGVTARSSRYADEYDGLYGLERSFRLIFVNEQEIVFFADTDEEKTKWLEVLRALVGHIPPHPLWAELLWQRQEELAKGS